MAISKIFGILLVIGVLLAGLGIYLAYHSYDFQRKAIHTEGEIIDLRYSHNGNSSSGVWYPLVKFTDNADQQRVFESSFGSTGYRNSLGERVEVIYEAGNPDNAKIKNNAGNYFSAIITGVFALVLVFIGGVGHYISAKGSRTNRLMHTGKPLDAKIVEVELNDAIQINGRSPWRIVCQWLGPQTNKVHIFRSGNIYYDPTDYLNGDKITVYVAPNNVKKYYVDISHLPESA